jgi:hypothetical protein
MFVNGLYSPITVYFVGLRPAPARMMCLVASLYLHTRYGLSRELSNTLYANFCLTAFGKNQPETINSAHGVQFSSHEFSG